jgi:hypothetical protein
VINDISSKLRPSWRRAFEDPMLDKVDVSICVFDLFPCPTIKVVVAISIKISFLV